MKVFVVLCMSLALVAGAAIDPKQEQQQVETKADLKPEAQAEAATGDKKHGKRGLFDFGYGFDSYGWGVPPVVIEKPVHYPVKIHVPVEKPVPVFIDRKVPVFVDRHIPVHVDRPVPYPVKVPVKVPVLHKVPYPVAVPKPYPVVVEKHIPTPVLNDPFAFGHHFSNGWVGHHGFGSSYSGFHLGH